MGMGFLCRIGDFWGGLGVWGQPTFCRENLELIFGCGEKTI